MGHYFERLVAWKYLWSPRREGFSAVVALFSFVGIVLGVATLLIVLSVMNGFRQELLNRILGMNGHLTVYSQIAPLTEYPELQKILAQNANVASCIPLIEKQGLFLAKGAAGGIIRGFLPDDLAKRSLIAQHMVHGTVEALSVPNTILIGHKLAQKIHLGLGDRLKIMVAENRPTAIGFLPRSRSFRVAGIFDSGMHEYDSAFVFISLASAQEFWDMPGVVSHMELFLKDPEKVRTTKREIQHTLEKHFPDTASNFVLYDWQQANAHFFNAIQVQRNVLFLILMLIVLVAVFNIVACLVMLVQDKTRDIAILRTLGATKGSILRIFLRVGGYIGVSGTLLGTLLGLGFAYNIDSIRRLLEYCSGVELFQAEIYFLSHLPVSVRLEEVYSVIFMSLGFSFLATLYPAWKASRLHPVEGLRYG